MRGAASSTDQLDPKKRNPVLKRKFFAIKDELPKHVIDFFEHPVMGKERVLNQTEIINNAFDRVGNKWVVKLKGSR